MFSFRVLESNDKEDASKDARCVSTETVDVTHAGGEAAVEDMAHVVKEMRLSINQVRTAAARVWKPPAQHAVGWGLEGQAQVDQQHSRVGGDNEHS